jgi:vacuolar-type H+-ATPase subunit F/Vma7
MKSIFSLAIAFCLSFSISAQSDAIERFFKDYQENENFTVVYVSPKMFQMVSKATGEIEDKELASIVKDLRGLRILTSKVNPDKIYKEANRRLNIKEYEELVTVKDKDSNVRFVTKETNGVIAELLLLVGGKDEFVMMSFVGNIDLNKIAKLAKKLDIDGAEHLEKVKKK